MAGRLAGKGCVITGGASRQGRAGAEAFAREGARLVLSDQDQDGLAEIGRIVSDLGSEPVLYLGDLTTEAANEELIEVARAHYGRVDAVYNVAGLVRFGK